MHVGVHPNFDQSRIWTLRWFRFRCSNAAVQIVVRTNCRFFGKFPSWWDAEIFVFGREISIFFVLHHVHHAVHGDLMARINTRERVRTRGFRGFKSNRSCLAWIQKRNRYSLIFEFQNRTALCGDVSRTHCTGSHSHHVGKNLHATTGFGKHQVVRLGLRIVVDKLNRERLVRLRDKSTKAEVHVGVHPNFDQSGALGSCLSSWSFGRWLCFVQTFRRFGCFDHNVNCLETGLTLRVNRVFLFGWGC